MKSDQGIIAAMVALGAVTVIGSLVIISRAKSSGMQGLGALARTGAVIKFQPAATMRPGVGAAIAWQQVSRGGTGAVRTVSRYVPGARTTQMLSPFMAQNIGTRLSS